MEGHRKFTAMEEPLKITIGFFPMLGSGKVTEILKEPKYLGTTEITLVSEFTARNVRSSI